MKLGMFWVGFEKSLNNFDRLVGITNGDEGFDKTEAFQEETRIWGSLFFCHEIKK